MRVSAVLFVTAMAAWF